MAELLGRFEELLLALLALVAALQGMREFRCHRRDKADLRLRREELLQAARERLSNQRAARDFVDMAAKLIPSLLPTSGGLGAEPPVLAPSGRCDVCAQALEPLRDPSPTPSLPSSEAVKVRNRSRARPWGVPSHGALRERVCFVVEEELTMMRLRASGGAEECWYQRDDDGVQWFENYGIAERYAASLRESAQLLRGAGRVDSLGEVERGVDDLPPVDEAG